MTMTAREAFEEAARICEGSAAIDSLHITGDAKLMLAREIRARAAQEPDGWVTFKNE